MAYPPSPRRRRRPRRGRLSRSPPAISPSVAMALRTIPHLDGRRAAEGPRTGPARSGSVSRWAVGIQQPSQAEPPRLGDHAGVVDDVHDPRWPHPDPFDLAVLGGVDVQVVHGHVGPGVDHAEDDADAPVDAAADHITGFEHPSPVESGRVVADGRLRIGRVESGSDEPGELVPATPRIIDWLSVGSEVW